MCRDSPESTACMSCSMNMPKFVLEQNIAAFGVSDLLWAFPEAGASCGMCLKILLPPGQECEQFDESNPFCAGQGSAPYSEFSSRPGDCLPKTQVIRQRIPRRLRELG
eukprot:TRINITY_DN108502_c0_g1_i1.p2 TRINITY_DN108502_c0_g1~~TRINITY_DN108502_c0_g1_i1.p2  ORF type:complete len:124 (-),score=5.82 TRINITY_DN108502_c0_g1_i1:2-325(-)